MIFPTGEWVVSHFAYIYVLAAQHVLLQKTYVLFSNFFCFPLELETICKIVANKKNMSKVLLNEVVIYIIWRPVHYGSHISGRVELSGERDGRKWKATKLELLLGHS